MTTGDVVARVVQLRGEEVVIVDTTDVERANDIGQFRPPVTHSANLFIGTGQSGRRQGECVTSARGLLGRAGTVTRPGTRGRLSCRFSASLVGE
jgi:hypothetical protein